MNIVQVVGRENMLLENGYFRPINASFCPFTAQYAHPTATFILATLAHRQKMHFWAVTLRKVAANEIYNKL